MDECRTELAAATARLARWSAATRPRRQPTAPSSAPHAQRCPEALEATDAAALAARRQAGQASCAKRRRGPTGGYCLRKGHASRGGNSCLSPVLATALLREAFVGDGPVVLDLGAGIGQYGRFFQEHAPSLRYVGLDGAENVEEATDGFVRFADLTDGLPRAVRALPKVDWVMSLEVAEHVPRASEARYLHTLTSLPTSGVLMSWAVPGQGSGGAGAKHVNCQWASYVDCTMGLLGFEWDSELEARLGKHRPNSTYPCPWLRYNLLAFRRAEGGALGAFRRADVRLLRSLLGGPVASSLFESLYANLTSAHCEPVVDVCSLGYKLLNSSSVAKLELRNRV